MTAFNSPEQEALQVPHREGIQFAAADAGRVSLRHLLSRPEDFNSGQATPTAPVTFYAEGAPKAEAERLKMMAARADEVSLNALGESVEHNATYMIVDIGAGESSTLAESLLRRNPGVKYKPIDMREEAVAAQRAAGWDAVHGTAFSVPFEKGSSNAAHARFVFGWLGNSQGRARALDEMLRVVKPSTDESPSRIAILDYDWTVAKGPKPVQELIDGVSKLMKGFGFDPSYGAKVEPDIKAMLKRRGLQPEHYTMTTERNQEVRPLSDALQTIALTIRPIIHKLYEINQDMIADYLVDKFEEIEQYAINRPNARVTFPDITSVAIELTDSTAHAAVVERIVTERQEKISRHQQRDLAPIEPSLLGTFILPEDMILEARRLHAQIYKEAGYVTDEAFNTNGTLREVIDPYEVIHASTYIGNVNEEGDITGEVRLIEHGEEPVTFLPTVGKLEELLIAQGKSLEDLPFDVRNSRVFEASALGKGVFSTDPLATTKLFLSVLCEAKAKGYDYCVIGFVKRTAGLLTGVYGDKAFKRVGDDSLTIKLDGQGIRPRGIELVPYYASTHTFFEDLLAAGHRLNAADVELIKATQAAVSQ